MRLLSLLIAIGEWIFGVNDEPDPLKDIWIVTRYGGIEIKSRLGETIMAQFTVPDDHQDEPFSIDPITAAADMEGNSILDQLVTSEVASDNTAAVSLVDVDNGDGTTTKKVHIEGPGVAHVGNTVFYQGAVIQNNEVTFVVTTGAFDPASVQGGGISFPGLTPDA